MNDEQMLKAIREHYLDDIIENARQEERAEIVAKLRERSERLKQLARRIHDSGKDVELFSEAAAQASVADWIEGGCK